MSHVEMTQKQKGARTQITDLPEIAVELSEQELRIVTGGLRAGAGCNSRIAPAATRGVPTDYNTNGDHDTD